MLELNRNGDHETVQGIIAYLNKEFIQSQQSANHRQLVLLLRNPSELEIPRRSGIGTCRKGGLIGMVAIALGSQRHVDVLTAHYLRQLMEPVLKSLSDTDQRVRSCSCHSPLATPSAAPALPLPPLARSVVGALDSVDRSSGHGKLHICRRAQIHSRTCTSTLALARAHHRRWYFL